MRRQLIAIVLLFCLLMPCTAQKQLTILHTNDTHSCILPLNPQLADTTLAGRGGFLRRIAMLKEERQKDPVLLYFDSGDFSQGSSYYTMFEGDVEIGLMNQMGIDASTIGNHEFDFGLENMARLFRMANFPIVCSNYDFTGTPCEGLVKPYIIKECGGRRVGIFGLCPRLEGLVSKANCEGVAYRHPTEVAQAVVDELRNEQGCDFVVCLSHLGDGDDDERDPAVIRATRGIDVVLGGHSHSYFEYTKYLPNADGREIPLDHQGKNARFVGVLDFEW